MRKLFVLGASVALLGVAALGLRWHLQRNAERTLTAFARAAAPFATLTWRESSLGFDGRIAARAVELQRRSDGRRFSADALWVDFGSLPDALRAGTEQPPARLRLGVDGFAYALDAVARLDESAALGLAALEVAPCAGRDASAALRELGHDPLSADLELGYAYDAALGQLAIETRVAARGLWTLDATLALDGPGPPTVVGFVGHAPIIRRGTLALTEHGGYAATAALCAQHAGLDAKAWLDAHLATAVERLAASGVVASTGLLAGYRDFRGTPRTAALSFDNAARLGLAELLGLDPGEFGRALGLRVEFNGARVGDAQFELVGSQQLPAVAPLADLPPPSEGEALVESSVRALLPPVAAPPPLTPLRSTARRAAPAPTRSLAWDALGRARGRWITVTLRDGRQHIGILRAVTPDQLTLEKRVFGGAVTFPLERGAVARISAMP